MGPPMTNLRVAGDRDDRTSTSSKAHRSSASQAPKPQKYSEMPGEAETSRRASPGAGSLQDPLSSSNPTVASDTSLYTSSATINPPGPSNAAPLLSSHHASEFLRSSMPQDREPSHPTKSPPPPTAKMNPAARDTLRKDTTPSLFMPSSPSSSLKNRTINPPRMQKRVSANNAVLYEPTSPPFFMPQNRSERPLREDRSWSEWKYIGQAQQLTTGTPIILPLGPPKLHWQLLPYDPTRSKRFIHFDISFPTDDIQYRQNSSHSIHHIPLPDADLDKPAANKTLTQMTIKFQHNPFKWDIDVTRNEGIRVHDVFEAIYAAFQEPLTSYEKELILYYRYAGYEEAFELRCKLTAENPVVDQRQVWKRVDALLHKTFFLGLTQSKWGGDWRLNVGGTMLTSKQGSIRRGGRDLSLGVPIYDLETTASNSPSVIYFRAHERPTPPHLDHTLKALPDAAFFSLPLSAAFVTNTHIENDDMRASWGACRICNFAGLNPFLQHESLCTLIDNISLLSPDPSSQDHLWAYFCRFVPLTVSFDSLGCDALPMIPLDGGLARWIDKLETYLENPRNTMTWLRGPSGTGKSIIAYTLASRLSQKNILTGSFFFSRRHANCRGARSVLLALAYQLGLSEPRAKEKIIVALDNDPGITSPARDLREQFVRLLIDPLEAIGRDSPSSSRVFVIDAVEECQDDALDLILLLARLLARLNDVGVGLQIFITSRDQCAGASIERYVPLRAFDITLIDVVPEIKLFLRESLDDIYTRHCLEYRRPWPTDEVLDRIVDRVGPYFNTAWAIVKSVEIPDHDPADMLDLICDLPMTPSSPPESLADILYKSTFSPSSLSVDILYKSIISTSDDVERAYVHLMIVVNLAGMLSCSQLDNLLNRGPSQMFSMHSVLSKLPPLVHVLASHDSPVRVCHESLGDFLSDPLRCGEQFIPQSLVHRLLAYCSLMVMIEELPDNSNSPLCFHLSRLATESSLMSLAGFNNADILSSVLCSPPEPMQFLDTLRRIMMMQGRAGSTADIRTKLAMGYFCCTWQLLQHLDLSTFGTLPTFRFLAHIRSLPVLLAFPIFLSFESARNSHAEGPSTPKHDPHIEALDAVAEIVGCVYALKYGPECRTGDALDYACTHWAYHLSLAEWDDDLRSILTSFMSQKLEQWLVRAWCLQDLETCLRTLCNVRELCLTENIHFDPDTQSTDANMAQQKADQVDAIEASRVTRAGPVDNNKNTDDEVAAGAAAAWRRLRIML